MSYDRWALLDELRASGNSILDLPPELMALIAERLEDVIGTASREPLYVLSQQVAELFGDLLRQAPAETLQAVRGIAAANSPASAAFTLGQLNFAHLLAAQAAEQRADERFLESLCDRRYKTYVSALAAADRTGIELADCTSEKEETVSRKLKLLRELGITDFRREGKNVVNFLTPAARAALAARTSAGSDDLSHVDISPLIASLRNGLPKHMQTSPIFSTTSETSPCPVVMQ